MDVPDPATPKSSTTPKSPTTPKRKSKADRVPTPRKPRANRSLAMSLPQQQVQQMQQQLDQQQELLRVIQSSILCVQPTQHQQGLRRLQGQNQPEQQSMRSNIVSFSAMNGMRWIPSSTENSPAVPTWSRMNSVPASPVTGLTGSSVSVRPRINVQIRPAEVSVNYMGSSYGGLWQPGTMTSMSGGFSPASDRESYSLFHNGNIWAGSGAAATQRSGSQLIQQSNIQGLLPYNSSDGQNTDWSFDGGCSWRGGGGCGGSGFSGGGGGGTCYHSNGQNTGRRGNGDGGCGGSGDGSSGCGGGGL